MGKPPGRYGQPLTRKQAAIMDQLCDGKKRAQIVEFTGMAKQTVDMHLARVKAKLGANTPTQAAVLYDRMRRPK